MKTLRIVVAPSGYKECLPAEAVAAAIARGVRRACPEADIVEMPLVDGGEGFARALVGLTGGQHLRTTVSGPLGDPVAADWGFLGPPNADTAILDMASAAGLGRVPRDRRDPLLTSTYGVGELIRAALDAGAHRIIVGCGDSGTNDGGAGMAEALGVRLLDSRGRAIGKGALGLLALADIDLSGLDGRIGHTPIEAACNMHNLLTGPRGVARVYGPQKGASDEAVGQLEAGLDRFAAIVRRRLGLDLAAAAGAGASGGLGAGLVAFLGAHLRSRYEVLSWFLDLEGRLNGADLVLTAEGGLDAQSATGKVPAEVGRHASRLGIPVIALAGTIGEGAANVRGHGISAFFATVPGPCTLAEALAGAETHIELCAENVMRTVVLSLGIGRKASRPGGS